MFICEFCNSQLSTKSSLIHHQKRTKFCLNKQKEKGIIDVIHQEYECDNCHKKFINKTIKDRHVIMCSSKYIPNIDVSESNKKIEYMAMEIKFLRNQNLSLFS